MKTGAMFGYWCCLKGRHKWICILDNANHFLPERFRFRRLCDLHDWYIVVDWGVDEDLDALEVATSRPPDGFTGPQ